MAALLQTTAYLTAIGPRPATRPGTMDAAIDRLADALFRPLRYALRWRRMARLLLQLDDQLLADVGIARDEIDPAARRVVAEKMGPRPAVGAALASLPGAARAAFAAWMARRAQSRALLRLDDRSLRDIGLTREMIHAADFGARLSDGEIASLSYPRGAMKRAAAPEAGAYRLDPVPANTEMANDNGLRRAS